MTNKTTLMPHLFIVIALMQPGLASASSWIKLVDYTKDGKVHELYINTSTFRRNANTASAILEDTEDKSTFQWIADCMNWRFRGSSKSKWTQAPRGSIADSVNSFMCSNDRTKKPSTPSSNDSSVKIKIEPPSLTDRVKSKLVDRMLDQMFFGY